MAIQIQKATKKKAKLRLAFDGPAGSGKTFTALAVGTAFAARVGGRVGVIDSERGSASLYADKFDFDVIELEDFAPDRYVEAIHAFEEGGYSVIVVDSLSHAWDGKGGALDLKDRVARKGGNDYTAWRDITPMHNRLVDALLQSRCHIIGTMRTKMEYVLEENEKGKKIPKKVGMAPVQRAGLEYEFTIVGDLDYSHVLTISKTRCELLDGQVIARPGAALAKTLVDWLEDGAVPAVPAAPPATSDAPAAPVTVTAPAAHQPDLAHGEADVQRFANAIRAAHGDRELQTIAAEIAAGVQSGLITQEQRKRLVQVYVEQLQKLPAPGAAA